MRKSAKPPRAARARNVLTPAGICGIERLAVRRRGADTVLILWLVAMLNLSIQTATGFVAPL
jgi:hypothetical protein